MRVRIEFSIRTPLHTKSSLNVQTLMHTHIYTRCYYYMENSTRDFTFFRTTDECAKQRRKQRAEEKIAKTASVVDLFLYVFFIANFLPKSFVEEKNFFFRRAIST